jgi:hypothetical protein
MKKLRRKNKSIENFIDSEILKIENCLKEASIKCRWDLIQFYQKELEIYYKVKILINQIK